MKVNLFEYHLPQELIAQQPVADRADSRMLVLHRDPSEIEHRQFRDLPQYLHPGDCLVINDTRVIPARLIGRRPTGGRVEMLLLRPVTEDDATTSGQPDGRADASTGSAPSAKLTPGLLVPEDNGERWEVLARPARRLKVGETIEFDGRLQATVEEERPEGKRIVAFRCDGELMEVLEEVGLTPLPPYIHRDQQPAPESSAVQVAQEAADRQRYQTVYAAQPGAVAAPTAGLHFDEAMLEQLEAAGVRIVRITLHTSAGTFRPAKTECVEDHTMDAEYYQISPDSAMAINEYRAAGGRIIAVGTTVVRTLETVANEQGRVVAGRGWSELFIYPGYQFKVIDALLTNFHLPRSTLLMLVCALAGREQVLAAYEEAVAQRYRFYSYGDCMLIQ